jgi:hypothetical protein
LLDYLPAPRASRVTLWLEWAALFVVFPVVFVALLDLAQGRKYPFFASQFAYAGIVWLIARPMRSAPARREWKLPLLHFVAAAPLLAGLVAVIDPALFFGFPRNAPKVFALYVLLYPLLSVWPQEFLYRRFYFWRYAPIFPSIQARVISSALAFCFLHAIYHNWIAVGLSLIGGWIFARDYARTGSLLVVWAEHSLYGLYIFTIGLGRFFYKAM